MTELLPCPFCGKKPLIRPKCPAIEGDAWTKITCDCRVEPSVTVYEDSMHFETAKRLWNTRATQPVDVEALKREAVLFYNETFENSNQFQSMPSDREVMFSLIDYLAAAGYLRAPLPKIEGLAEAIWRMEGQDMAGDEFGSEIMQAARAYQKASGG